MAFIELHGVSRSFMSGADTVHALRDIDLQIERGEFVAVVGPSGGGKTTLLSIIGGLDAPSTGRYILDGAPVPRQEGAALAQLRAQTFSFIFQGFHLLEQRPAADSVGLGLRYLGVPAAERRERASSAAERVGMASRLAQRTVTLSAGQRQRLAIARAIATGSPVLLADEPTGNLDSTTGAQVMDELVRLHRSGMTIVVVTHSADVAAAASRVVRITDGVLTEDRRANPVFSAAEVDVHETSAAAPVDRRPGQGWAASIDMLRDAAASVYSRSRQSLALATTVGLAVALLVTTIGLTNSTTAQVNATFDAHANREVTVSWSTDEQDLSASSALDAAASLSGTDAAAVITSHPGMSVGNLRGDERMVTVNAAVGDLVTAGGIVIEGEPDLAPGEALIGASLAEQLALGPVSARPSVTVDGDRYTVRGIVTSSSRLPMMIGEVIVSEQDVPPVLTPGQRQMLILARPGAAPQVGRQLPAALDPYSPASFAVQVPTDPRSLRGEIEGGVQTSLIAFTAVSGLIALLTLMNTIGAAVTARRPELGLRRALGARSGQLAGLVSTEAALLGGLGGLGGPVVGMLGILAFTVSQRWVPVFDVRLAPAAIAAGVTVGALASVLGAVRAARVRPSDALRQGT